MKIDPKREAALKEACGLYLELLGKSLPTEEELASDTPPFSDRFHRRMERLFRRQKKFYYSWINTAAKRVACALILLFLAATTVTFSVEALREPFIRFVVETFEKGSYIIFPDDTEEDQPIVATLPSYIPKDFELAIDVSDDLSVVLHYEDPYQNTLSFLQFPKGSHMSVNTEGIHYEIQMIQDIYEGMYFEKNGERTLVFATSESLYNISGDLSKEELLKIAESIPLE